MPTVTVTFDRIGRNHNVPPLHIAVDDAASIDELSDADKGRVYDAVYAHARPHLTSRGVEVMFAPPKVHFLAGFRNAGDGEMTLDRTAVV